MARDYAVICVSHRNLTNVRRLMAESTDSRRDRERQVGVHQKTHAASGGQWMMLLLLDQIAGEFQRRANIVAGYTILALHFIECHPASEATYHDGNRQGVPRITGLP